MEQLRNGFASANVTRTARAKTRDEETAKFARELNAMSAKSSAERPSQTQRRLSNHQTFEGCKASALGQVGHTAAPPATAYLQQSNAPRKCFDTEIVLTKEEL